MFHHSFGQNLFIEALRNYLNKYKYGNVRPEFLAAEIQYRLEKESKIPGNPKVDIFTLMNSWANQSGYPVVNVTLNNNEIIFSQVKF